MGPVGRAGSRGAVFLLLLAIILIFPSQLQAGSVRTEVTGPGGLPAPNVEYDDRIYIEGNAGFTSSNGVSSGSGTQGDPYIIEDRHISAFHGIGLSIRNTTKHWTVRNCTITGGADNTTREHYGMVLFNSFNGRVEGCRLMRNRVNLYACELVSSQILDNVMNGSTDDCIQMIGGTYLNLSHNVIWAAYNDGISLDNVDGSGLYRNEVYLSRIGISIVTCSGISAFHNRVHDNWFIGLEMTASSNITCRDNVLRFNSGKTGAMISLCSKVDLSKNAVVHSPVGIFLDQTDGSSVSINDNNISECNTGIELNADGARVGNNRISNNLSSTGIYLIGTKGAEVTGNLIKDGLVGIRDELGSYDLLIGNRVEYSEIGLDLYCTNYLSVRSNNVTGPETGIRLYTLVGGGSVGNVIEDNTVEMASKQGILLGDSCYSNRIERNLISDCHTAIRHYSTTGGDHNRFHGNDLVGYSYAGIHLDSDLHGSVRSNTFDGYDQALILTQCAYTEIVDNRFEDPDVWVEDSMGKIVWNTDRTPGTNIMGGPYIMGNYWSDYEGTDINGDGIGDTDLPHGPGDNGPLMKDPVLDPDTTPPWLEDLTKGRPRTGTEFANVYIAHDDRPFLDLTAYVQVEYLCSTIDGWCVLSRSTVEAGADYELRVQVDVPKDALELRVTLAIEDFSGNNHTTSFEYDCIDIIEPVMVQVLNDGSALTGRKFRVEYDLFDNCGFSPTCLVYCKDEPGSQTISCPPVEERRTQGWGEGVGLNSIFEIYIPVHFRSLRFWPEVKDLYGNALAPTETIVPVIDATSPVVDLAPGQVLLSGKDNTLIFDASDNWGISRAELDVWADEEGPRDAGDPVIKGDTLTFSFELTREVFSLFFALNVWDESGNIAYLQGSLNVTDGIPPEIMDITPYQPRTGMQHDLQFSIWDNQGVSMSFVSWWCDSSGDTNVTDPKGSVQIEAIPVEALILNYRVGARDLQGNWNIVTYRRPVVDVTDPSVIIEDGVPETDKDFLFRVRSTDNREVVSETVKCFSEPDGLPCDTDLVQPGLYKVRIPGTMTFLRIRATVQDGTGNEAAYERTVMVKDSTPPIITASGMEARGDRGLFEFFLTATDNRGIGTARVVITDGNRTLEGMELNCQGDRNYRCTWEIGHERFGYFFVVTDLEGNSATSLMEVYRSEDDGGPAFLWAYLLVPLMAFMAIASLAFISLTIGKRQHTEGTLPTPGRDVQTGSRTSAVATSDNRSGLFKDISTRGRELVNVPLQNIRERKAQATEERMALYGELERERFALMSEEIGRITDRYLGRPP